MLALQIIQLQGRGYCSWGELWMIETHMYITHPSLSVWCYRVCSWLQVTWSTWQTNSSFAEGLFQLDIRRRGQLFISEGLVCQSCVSITWVLGSGQLHTQYGRLFLGDLSPADQGQTQWKHHARQTWPHHTHRYESKYWYKSRYMGHCRFWIFIWIISWRQSGVWARFKTYRRNVGSYGREEERLVQVVILGVWLLHWYRLLL